MYHNVVAQCSPSLSLKIHFSVSPHTYLDIHAYYFGLRFNAHYHTVQNKDLQNYGRIQNSPSEGTKFILIKVNHL